MEDLCNSWPPNAIFETNSALGCILLLAIIQYQILESKCLIRRFQDLPWPRERISELVTQLAAEDREVDHSHMLSLESPDAEFDADSAHQELLKIRLGELSESFAEPVHGKLLIDSSKGAAGNWLAGFLCELGIDAEEISGDAIALNENCGAGEFNPTDSWTWEEAAMDDHLLIKSWKDARQERLLQPH